MGWDRHVDLELANFPSQTGDRVRSRYCTGRLSRLCTFSPESSLCGDQSSFVPWWWPLTLPLCACSLSVRTRRVHGHIVILFVLASSTQYIRFWNPSSSPRPTTGSANIRQRISGSRGSPIMDLPTCVLVSGKAYLDVPWAPGPAIYPTINQQPCSDGQHWGANRGYGTMET